MLDWTTKGDRLVVSVSGGKDSAAVCLFLMEQGYGPDDYDRVFADTGWELPEVYDYLRGPLTEKVGPITEVKATFELPDELLTIAQDMEQRLGVDYSAMIRMVLRKATIPNRMARFCTRELKIKPVAAKLQDMDGEPVSVVGIRAEESAARAAMPEWEWGNLQDCWTWRPLIDWTFEDVAAIHRRHNLLPAAPYLAGADRVGCAPCIMCRKSEIEWLADNYPERMDVLEELEAVVTRLASAKREAKGQPAFKHPLGWFSAKDSLPVGHPLYRHMWPIREVIAWAKGPQNQVEMFTPREKDFGCMRWGFCDAGKEGD
jgi:3'-phosphoadenosine 5'-phosphosulfate sulfotransferase (PAPS reductase)/FAD synthetase